MNEVGPSQSTTAGRTASSFVADRLALGLHQSRRMPIVAHASLTTSSITELSRFFTREEPAGRIESIRKGFRPGVGFVLERFWSGEPGGNSRTGSSPWQSTEDAGS